jgi:hypothetical protein
MTCQGATRTFSLSHSLSLSLSLPRFLTLHISAASWPLLAPELVSHDDYRRVPCPLSKRNIPVPFYCSTYLYLCLRSCSPLARVCLWIQFTCVAVEPSLARPAHRLKKTDGTEISRMRHYGSPKVRTTLSSLDKNLALSVESCHIRRLTAFRRVSHVSELLHLDRE